MVTKSLILKLLLICTVVPAVSQAIVVTKSDVAAMSSIHGELANALDNSKMQKELDKYTSKEVLIMTLMDPPNPNYAFNKKTVYLMRNFKLMQKVLGGFLIMPNSNSEGPNFRAAFLQTTKKIPEAAIISGVVIYDGEFKYTGTNGFSRSAPKLKIPAKLPLSYFFEDGDPFNPKFL